MFLYRSGLVVMVAVIVLAATALLTGVEDSIAIALCRVWGYPANGSGDGSCGFNADLQTFGILSAIFILGLLMTAIGALFRRRETARRRMFGPRN